MSLHLSAVDMVNLALAASTAASLAYVDAPPRLLVAATDHHLAARLWAEAGFALKARHHSMLAEAISAEMLALAAGEEEDA